MKIVILLVLLSLRTAVVAAASDPFEPNLDELTQAVPPAAPSAVARFDELNSLIRDGRIRPATARAEFTRRLAALDAQYRAGGAAGHSPQEWVFPLAGHDIRAVAGGRSHGFSGRGYDYYTGNRHGGHPALDIFIRDRNRDSRDDHTGQPVRVLSMGGGIVVALEREWQPDSRLRGGRYIWIYDPANRLLAYYAHNDEVLVGLGDLVRPGDPIATVGRSGFNAAKRRSPTHLHFSLFRVDGPAVTPLNPYPLLKRTRRAPA